MSASQKQESFREKLLSWYKKNGRSFSWRHTKNPFHILVAEFLLRKTQADRVAIVYDNFCSKYQKPQDMLEANPIEIEENLKGLGLQQRIRWLLETCEQLVKYYQGRVPSTYESLCELKGVGSYTANMILCLGYGQDCIPIDNNVARLVSRVFGVKRQGDTRKEREVESALTEIKTNGKSKDISLAMLDFSALRCRASKPDCVDCPLTIICEYVKE